ncbi:MAG: tetratricopeptide repeat protein [Thermodesulfobacteriota bacterium]
MNKLVKENRVRTFFSFVFIGLLFFLPSLSMADTEAVKRLKKGDKYLLNYDYESAIEYYTKAISLNVNLIDAYIHRGAAYREVGALDSAIRDYNRAISIKPIHDAFYNRAVVYADKGDTDRAIKDYTNAISKNPQSVMAFNNRGIIHASRGRFDKSIEDFTRVISIEPANAYAYSNRSAAYKDKRKYQKAIDDLMKVVELVPNNFHTYYNIARLYALKADDGSACRFLRKSVEKGFRDWSYLGFDPEMKKVSKSACFKEIMGAR